MATHDNDTERRGDLAVKERSKTRRPPMWKVLLHNDDYTTMEFVVEILMRFFNRTPTEATRIMLHVHRSGKGVAGVFTREVAETKVHQVHEHARLNEHPLRCTMEPD